MPTTTGALTSTESWTPTSSRCQRSWSFVASRSGRPTYAVVPLRETTLIASGSRPNRRRMSATAMYGRDVRYRRRLDVLGRLDADMSCVGSLRLRARWRGVPGLRPGRKWARGRSHLPFAEHAAENEQDVGGPLGEPAHEIRIPLGPVRHVDAQSIALSQQPALEIPPDAEQHLELEAVLTDVALAREGADALDHVRIVGGDPRIRIRLEETL